MNTDIHSQNLHRRLEEVGIFFHDFEKPLYKYASVENAKKILTGQTLRFSTPASFNDPFDFNIDFLDHEITEDNLQFLFKDRFNSIPDLNSKQKELINRTSVEDFKKSYRNTLERQRHKSLVFCTSEINNNILMWSHYGSCHRGVCIGFQIPHVLQDIEAFTKKVGYVDLIQSENFYTDDANQSVFALAKWALTKSSCWSYEREVRTVIINAKKRLKEMSGDYELYKIDKSAIKELYFGCETKADDIRSIQQILKDNDYNINPQQMKKSHGKFALEPTALDLLSNF